MMTGSPTHDAQLQQQLQQHAVLSGELHHQYQSVLPQPGPPPPPPSTSSSSPWQTLSELTELPLPDDMDDGGGLPLPLPPQPPPPHPGVMATATPFQQLVGSFGPGGTVSAGGGETDDDSVVSLDEPLRHHAAPGSAGGRDGLDVRQTRSAAAAAHVLFAPQQRLNAPA